MFKRPKKSKLKNMKTTTKTRSATNAKLAIATLALLIAGGAAFATLPSKNIFEKNNYNLSSNKFISIDEPDNIITSKPISLKNYKILAEKPSYTTKQNKKINAEIKNLSIIDPNCKDGKCSVFADGCYIKNNEKLIWLDNSWEDCVDVYLAYTYAPKNHFLQLLKYLGYSGFNDNDILHAKSLDIIYAWDEGKNKLNLDYYQSLISNQNECLVINYFGVNLFCFNEVKSSFFHIEKHDNLKQIITYLTFLIHTSNRDHNNLLVGRHTNAHEFLKQEKVSFIDGAKPDLYERTLENIRCTNEEGPANYNRQDKAAYICNSFLKKDSDRRENIIVYSGILYHEANHKHQGGHDYHHTFKNSNYREQGDTLPKNGVGEEGNTNLVLDGCADNTEYGSGIRRDKDLKSVYGAHIALLFSISQNPSLNRYMCQYKQIAYEQAEWELKRKICQYPNSPNYDWERPVCN